MFAWTDGQGVEIGRAYFTSNIEGEARVTVWLDNGREAAGFKTAAEALAWIEGAAS